MKLESPIKLFVLVLSTLLCLSCGDKKNNPDDGQSTNRLQDQLLTTFPDLVAMHDIKRAVNSDTAGNYYLRQEYRLEGKNELFTGTLTDRHPNDSLNAKGVFEDGNIEQFSTWYRSGNLKSEMVVLRDNPDIDYQTRTWYESGRLQSEYNNFRGKKYFESGNLRSVWSPAGVTDYWENGNRRRYMSLDSEKRNYRLHGEWKYWHSNGTLQIEGIYVNGKRDGRWIHQDSLGNLEKIVHYTQGTVDSTISNP